MRVLMMGNYLRPIIVLFVVLCFGACSKSEDEKSRPNETSGAAQSSKSTGARQTGSGDAGLSGMVLGVIEQLSKQGVKIEGVEKQEALTQVIKLYLIRNDLQKAFGGPGDVDFTTMVKWAAVSGTTTDSDKDKLAAYATPLRSIAHQIADAPIRVRLE